MTTYIDILDTAVKIGLGAALTGLATYLVTKLKSDQNHKNEVAKYNRALIERISLEMEESATTIQRVIDLLPGPNVVDEDEKRQRICEAQNLYLNVYEQVNKTQALTTLVGTLALREKLKAYGKLASDLHELVRFKPYDYEELDSVIDRLNTARHDLRDAIHATYEQRAS